MVIPTSLFAANASITCAAPDMVHSRGPDVLSHAFDPVAQLIDTAIPVPQPPPHAVNLLHIQYLWLHPIDPRYPRHLVDTPLQQSQTQGLHDQDLDVLRLDVRLLRDGAERHRAVVGRAAKDGLGESAEGDFLGEEVLMGGEQRRHADLRLEALVRGEIAAVVGEEEIAEPGVRGRGQAVENRV